MPFSTGFSVLPGWLENNVFRQTMSFQWKAIAIFGERAGMDGLLSTNTATRGGTAAAADSTGARRRADGDDGVPSFAAALKASSARRAAAMGESARRATAAEASPTADDVDARLERRVREKRERMRRIREEGDERRRVERQRNESALSARDALERLRDSDARLAALADGLGMSLDEARALAMDIAVDGVAGGDAPADDALVQHNADAIDAEIDALARATSPWTDPAATEGAAESTDARGHGRNNTEGLGTPEGVDDASDTMADYLRGPRAHRAEAAPDPVDGHDAEATGNGRRDGLRHRGDASVRVGDTAGSTSEADIDVDATAEKGSALPVDAGSRAARGLTVGVGMPGDQIGRAHV